jgi:hypothetical protein
MSIEEYWAQKASNTFARLNAGEAGPYAEPRLNTMRAGSK